MISGLKGRKRDTAVLGSILFLAFFFLTLSSILLSSFSGTARRERQRLHGAWQMLYYGAEADNPVLRLGLPPYAEMRLVGETNSGRLIGTIDEAVLQTAGLTLTEGRLPEGEDEILLVRGRMPVEPAVGETLDVTYSFADMRAGTASGAESVEKEAVLSSVREMRTEADRESFRAYLAENHNPQEGTVTGYASPYADHWDVRGLAMPDAFVSPEANDQVLRALDFAAQYYSEGSKAHHTTGILLFAEEGLSPEEKAERILPLYRASVKTGSGRAPRSRIQERRRMSGCTVTRF